MKKYFKFLGLALLATSMFGFTACEDDENTNTEVAAAEEGVTVTFGNNTWTANYFEGATYLETDGRNKQFFAIYATPNNSIGTLPYQEGGEEEGYITFPMLYFQTEADEGNNHGGDVYVQYYEKAENTYALQDGDGDWDFYGWEKGSGDDDNMTIVVTDFNSSNFVISGTINGTLYEIRNDQTHTGEMKTLNVVFKNIALEDLDAEEE
jgi:hypothetical protein